MRITIIANRIAWMDQLREYLQILSVVFKERSEGRLDVQFKIIPADFYSIPKQDFMQSKCVDINWYRKNITPLSLGHGTIFLMNPEDYNNGSTWGFMTYGDTSSPVRMEIATGPELDPYGVPIFVNQAYHEICHMISFLDSQPDVVHEYLYHDPPKPKEFLLRTDWERLAIAIAKIKHREPIPIRTIGWNDEEKGIYVGFDTPDRQVKFIKQLKELFPDYALDLREHNLGDRPWS